MAGNHITKVVQTVVDPEKLLSVKESSAGNLITKEPLAGNIITKEPLAGNIITKDVQTVVAPVMSISDPVLHPSTGQVVDGEANNCNPINLHPVSASAMGAAPNNHIPTAPMSGKLTLLMSKED